MAIPTADTIIEVDDNIISNIPNRSRLQRGQTPQCFKLSLIKKAHELSKNDKNFTDDCGLIVKYNLAKVYVVNGDIENIKVTYPSDIFMADRLFQIRSQDYPKDKCLVGLKDKVIVIFGGTKGIGKSTSDLALENGAKVFATSSSLGCDVSSYSSVENYLKEVFEETNRIDYVINSAGILRMGKLAERNIDDIVRDIYVNYTGSVNVAKASIPYLQIFHKLH